MSRLNHDARLELKWAGVTQAAWARHWFADGKWHGDACGCTDDRCAGFHHDERDECGCLRYLLEEYLREVPA